MTFNDGAKIDSSTVKRRGPGKGGGVAIGGGVALLLVVLSQIAGVDLTGLLGDQGAASSSETQAALADCDTGADANENIDCRVDATAGALDAYWKSTGAHDLGIAYRSPTVVAFSGTAQSACGAASASTGPFYCPTDESIYIDTAFYQTLRSQFGASAGNLAQLYVLAHEWGHHIQQLEQTLDAGDRTDTGADSYSTRLELQADCYAGVWIDNASSVVSESGVTFLKVPTQAELADALDAAAAVGDDHIQHDVAGGAVNPDAWTHGSSEMRQRWFTTGFDSGDPLQCTSLQVPASQL